MCDKVTLKNSGMFGFIPDCHKNQKVWKLRALNYVPECHNTHNMFDKAVDAFLPKLKPWWYRLQYYYIL